MEKLQFEEYSLQELSLEEQETLIGGGNSIWYYVGYGIGYVAGAVVKFNQGIDWPMASD